MFCVAALPCLALSTSRPHNFSRRGALGAAGGAALGAALPAHAVEEEDVKVYFGAGCFWHVQHEFVLKEAAELGRSGAAFSAVTGYAGGTGTERGLVCYHNGRGVSDYGRLGHAEAVQVTIPPSALPAFASKFIGIFGTRGYRHDPQDRGGEYRSVLGLPGGTASPHYSKFLAAAEGSPMKLVEGKGSEGDTLGAREILVMDSDKFPFYRAELYHQYHNDFQGPAYGTAYNRLQGVLAKEGRLGTTGCPEESF
jgi:peptide methionine sulfoxide reductase MsrA